MSTKVWESYEPNFRQERFHRVKPWKFKASDGRDAYALVKLYTGALGAGKSTGCEEEQGMLCLRIPDGKSIAVRQSMDRSYSTLIEDYQRIFAGHGRWLPSKEHFALDNGHQLYVTPADKFDRFGSTQYCTFYMQEAQEMKEPIFTALEQRLRNPAGVIDGVSFNRGFLCARGVMKTHWIYKTIVEPGWKIESGEEERDKCEKPHYAWIQGKTDDNQKNLEAGYKERLLMGHKNDKRYELMFIEGDFGFDLSGTPVFDEFSSKVHVRRITPDPTLPILRGIDFGFRHPAVVWCQYTKDGRLLVLRELTPTKCPRHELVARVEAEQQASFPEWSPRHYRDFGDIAGEQENSTGTDDVEYWENYFGNAVESRKSRIKVGLDVMHDLMQKDRLKDGELVKRFIVDESCDRLITALSGGYCYEADKQKDEPVKDNGYDDVVDAVRYVALQVAEEAPMISRSVSDGPSSSSYAAY